MCKTLYFYFCIPYHMLTIQHFINSPYSWPTLYIFPIWEPLLFSNPMFVFIIFFLFFFFSFFPFKLNNQGSTQNLTFQPGASELEAQSFKQWTTRKVPCFCLL